MRVLYVYKDYFPIRGGIEHHVQVLAEGLREAGVETSVLATNTGRGTLQEEIHGVPVLKTGRWLSLQSAPLSPALFTALRRLSQKVDIVHLHLPYPPAELAQLIMGRAPICVVTYHSDIVRQRLLGTCYRPFQRRLLKQVAGISVSNPRLIETSPQLRPYAAKCRVIAHGIDLQRLQPTAAVRARSVELRHQYGPAIVLFVGRLRHYKGIDVLIRALAELSARALIVGSGPMASSWQALARALGLSDRVHFLGEVAEAELVALYHAADVFVLPSTNRAETWGTVQIEAMAAGLPVVCTEVGTGTSYVNQHQVTGLVVPPGDASALAAALRRLLGDPEERARMGRAAQQRATQLFSQQAMLRDTKAWYEALVGVR